MSSSTSTSTVQKDSSLDSQESNNQDKTQSSLTRCNSVDSKAHLVLNVSKTAQAKYNTIPALKANTNGSSKCNAPYNKSTAKTPTSPTTVLDALSVCSPHSHTETNHCNSYASNHHTNLRIHMDAQGGILNTAFIDNATCPIHCSTIYKGKNERISDTPATPQPAVYTSQYNDVQLRRHSAYAKVYGDAINDNKFNLNQQQLNAHRPLSFVQTIVSNNGQVTPVQQHQYQQQQNIPQQPTHIKENDNGKTPRKCSWLKAKK